MKVQIPSEESTRRKVASTLSTVINFQYLKNLFRLFRSEYKTYGWKIVLLGILSFFSGILEGFGITAIIPIFSFVYKGKAESTDIISQFIENFFTYFHLPYTLKFLLIFIFVVFVAKAVLVFVVSQISARISTSYEKKTSAQLLHTTLHSDWKNLGNQKVGNLSQILTNDVSNSSALLTYISTFLITTTNLCIYTLLVFNISSVIAGLTVLFGVVVFFTFKPLLYRNKILAQNVVRLYKDSAHYVEEAMIGVKAIKSMSLENEVAARGFSYFDKVRTLIMRTATLKNISNALLQPLGLLLILTIFAYFYKTSTLNFGSFAVIVYAINKVFANIQAAQIQLHKISSTVPYLHAIVEHKKTAEMAQEKDTGKNMFSFSDRLEFKNVSFGYGEKNKVLNNLNFSIKKGEMVGVIGPSGSGKTTVTDLILRLFSPTEGEIVIDTKSIDSIQLSDWRKHIGYVSQDSFLVNDTIENNIKFYKEMSHKEVVTAAKMANIYEFINQLPEKFNTMVGERGIKLSGGQRQRIVLARVLAIKPQILILDEATSALDNESEVLIQETISNLKGNITVIAIAHRLTTVTVANKLIVIENGQILEQGSPDELFKNKESYLSRVYNLR